MMIQAAFCVPVNSIGKIWRESSIIAIDCSPLKPYSIRQKIRNGDPEFMVTASSWPRFLYTNSHYDPTDVEKGLFQSKILLKVRSSLFTEHRSSIGVVQAFKALFTSPSSARSVQREDENEPPQSKRSKKSTTRQHVAAILGITAVTPRSIAYTVIQVCPTNLSPNAKPVLIHDTQLRFALSSLNSWSELDGDFSCSDFYNSIIDYFENTPGPRSKARVTKLLNWWTSCVIPILLYSENLTKTCTARYLGEGLPQQGLLDMPPRFISSRNNVSHWRMQIQPPSYFATTVLPLPINILLLFMTLSTGICFCYSLRGTTSIVSACGCCIPLISDCTTRQILHALASDNIHLTALHSLHRFVLLCNPVSNRYWGMQRHLSGVSCQKTTILQHIDDGSAIRCLLHRNETMISV
jgi:hypothetical protein